MSDEYLTPTALGAERNGSRSQVARLGQPGKTFGKVGVQEAHALLQSRMNTAAEAFIRGRSPV